MISKDDNFIKKIEEIRDNLVKNIYGINEYKPKQINEYIEYGKIINKELSDRISFELKVKNTNFSVKSIIWELEDNNVYTIIQNQYSNLSINEISGIQRLITILILGFCCEEYIEDTGEIEIIKYDYFNKEIEKIRDSVIKKGYLFYHKEDFDKQFFLQCSETPDNIESIRYIEYGYIINDRSFEKIYGLKVIGKDMLLSEFINVLENKEVHKFLLDRYELEIEEIYAIKNVIYKILKSLECKEAL